MLVGTYLCDMKDVTLTINKADVYDEVAKTTSYVGAKLQGEEGAYNRIFTKDADQLMLERFWVAACDGATAPLKRYISEVSTHEVKREVDMNNNYTVKLSLPDAFDDSLVKSIQSSLFNYFALFVTSKWFRLVNRSETDPYLEEAVSFLDDAVTKIYHRTRPVRPTYTESTL